MNKILYTCRLIKTLFLIFWQCIDQPESPWKQALKDKENTPLRTNQSKYVKAFLSERALFTTRWNESGEHGLAELISIHASQTLATKPDEVRQFRTNLMALISICIYADVCAQKIQATKKETA